MKATEKATTTASSMFSKAYVGQVLDHSESDEEKQKVVSSSQNTADNNDKDVDNDWFSGKLKFRKHIDDAYRNTSSDNRKIEDYEVVDPRHQFTYKPSANSR